MNSNAFTFTKTMHKGPYPAISPTRPELCQAGKTILVTGGGSGIGFAIARAFLQARADKVIIASRRESVVKDAAASLGKEFPQAKVVGKACDIGDPASIAKFWESLANEATVVDVLVLNAAAFGEKKMLLDSGTESIWSDYMVNARGNLDMTERFWRQGKGKPKVILPLLLENSQTLHDLEESTHRCCSAVCRELVLGGDSPLLDPLRARVPQLSHHQERRHSHHAADCLGHPVRGDADREHPPRCCLHRCGQERWSLKGRRCLGGR
jgi:hypothetical protein